MNLTPASHVVIALICLLGIVHQWREPGAFPWWQLLVVVYVACLGYEWVRVRSTRIGVSPGQTDSLRLGRQGEVTLEFTNPHRRPAELQFAPALPGALATCNATRTVRLGTEDVETVPVPVLPTVLGRHAWPRLPMRIRGHLSLCWWSFTRRLDAECVVVPDMLGARADTTGDVQTGNSQRRVLGAGQELYQLREYLPGDPRHTIDWKATARTGGLITRLYSEDQHLEIMLVVDAGRTSRTHFDGLSQLGHYVNLTARFAEHAVTQDDQVGLVAVADKPIAVVPPTRGERAVQDIRRVLGELATQPVETDLISAARALHGAVRHRCLIILLTDLYGVSASGGLTQCVRLWVPKHLPMVVGLVGEELKALSEQTASDWLDPYTSVAAREYQRNLKLGSTSLQRLGAHALVVRPADLEYRVFSQYRLLKEQRRI